MIKGWFPHENSTALSVWQVIVTCPRSSPGRNAGSFPEYVGLCRAMYGYVWLCRAMYGCVWPCMAMYGYVGLCKAMESNV